MSDTALNIIVTGVGGQGILTLSQILGRSILRKGIKVLIAETHGMSQRGGSVVVHVRAGDDVYSPLIPAGMADIMLALEAIEAARYSYMLKKRRSVIILNNKLIRPSIPNVKVPSLSEILRTVRNTTGKVIVINASEEALRLGNPLGANMYVLGYAVRLLEVMGYVDLNDCMREVDKIGPKFIREANAKIVLKAYRESKEVLKKVLEGTN